MILKSEMFWLFTDAIINAFNQPIFPGNGVERCHTKLDEARRLVDFEHETWSMVNQRLTDDSDDGDSTLGRTA